MSIYFPAECCLIYTVAFCRASLVISRVRDLDGCGLLPQENVGTERPLLSRAEAVDGHLCRAADMGVSSKPSSHKMCNPGLKSKFIGNIIFPGLLGQGKILRQSMKLFAAPQFAMEPAIII